MNKNENYVITINRELGSGGRTVGEKLAQRLFFFWYQPEQRREIINELRRIHRPDLIDKLYGRRG